MKYKTILGIDVGKSGGIVVIDVATKEIIATHKTPLIKVKDEKDTIDILGHLQLLSDYSDVDALAVVEKVQGRHGDSAHSAFGFGFTCATMHTSLMANQIEFSLCHSKTWMKYYGMAKNGDTDTDWKNRLKDKAVSLYPSSSKNIFLWNSDAVLLAHYGLMVLNK